MSVPPPFSTISCPSPVLKYNVLLPNPALIISSPLAPVIVSLLTLPIILSAPSVPFIVPEPVIVSGFVEVYSFIKSVNDIV